MKINVAYNTVTFEVIKTTNSRNWLRRHIIRGWSDLLPRTWKFYTEIVPDDYFTRG